MTSTILRTEFLLQFQKQQENSAILLASNRPHNKDQTKVQRKTEREKNRERLRTKIQKPYPKQLWLLSLFAQSFSILAIRVCGMIWQGMHPTNFLVPVWTNWIVINNHIVYASTEEGVIILMTSTLHNLNFNMNPHIQQNICTMFWVQKSSEFTPTFVKFKNNVVYLQMTSSSKFSRPCFLSYS